LYFFLFAPLFSHLSPPHSDFPVLRLFEGRTSCKRVSVCVDCLRGLGWGFCGGGVVWGVGGFSVFFLGWIGGGVCCWGGGGCGVLGVVGGVFFLIAFSELALRLSGLPTRSFRCRSSPVFAVHLRWRLPAPVLLCNPFHCPCDLLVVSLPNVFSLQSRTVKKLRRGRKKFFLTYLFFFRLSEGGRVLFWLRFVFLAERLICLSF